jgi:hypothetical protein
MMRLFHFRHAAFRRERKSLFPPSQIAAQAGNMRQPASDAQGVEVEFIVNPAFVNNLANYLFVSFS